MHFLRSSRQSRSWFVRCVKWHSEKEIKCSCIRNQTHCVSILCIQFIWSSFSSMVKYLRKLNFGTSLPQYCRQATHNKAAPHSSKVQILLCMWLLLPKPFFPHYLLDLPDSQLLWIWVIYLKLSAEPITFSQVAVSLGSLKRIGCNQSSWWWRRGLTQCCTFNTLQVTSRFFVCWFTHSWNNNSTTSDSKMMRVPRSEQWDRNYK